MFSSRFFALAAVVATVSAQSLSTGCTNTLAAVAQNADAAACLSPGSLITLATGGVNASIIAPINTWLTAICGAPACSNDTLAAVVQNVTTGCSTELSSLGLTSDISSSITPLVQQYYPTVRKVVCLKDGSTNCVTQTLTNIQNAVGNLSISNIAQIIANPPSTIPANVSCTDCIKAAYNVINHDVPSLVSDSASSLQSQCGASFTDGTTPSNIVDSVSTATGTSKTTSAALGALSMLPKGSFAAMGASGIVVLSTMIAMLA
ncbi:hypothetical protein BDN70DRAFT_866068 [Pholiota conissans]|uniref:Secreted protein n=1 Tax=Pholiota conissans TaxID=109636 RepID=A0A9P5YVB9_9AGAR|nr:hypothetical protein BDN70DRAFT_866068 [Pholiota conissans]